MIEFNYLLYGRGIVMSNKTTCIKFSNGENITIPLHRNLEYILLRYDKVQYFTHQIDGEDINLSIIDITNNKIKYFERVQNNGND